MYSKMVSKNVKYRGLAVKEVKLADTLEIDSIQISQI